ncbi:MAG TPA: aquaporin, partial [Blastococcus sp.]
GGRLRPRRRHLRRRPADRRAVNPARAFGPNLLAGELAPLWIYLVAPTIGGVLAALLHDRVLSSAQPPEQVEATR